MKSCEENGYLYGKRLLQGMGWSEGKGLGKHEDGIKEFIKVKKKMNTKGIGFNGVDDRWIEHQEAFDDLLATLNGGRPPEDQQQLSAIEERSRRLGGRVHYSKFLRGKDLSQKKQKEIDAIIIRRKRDKVADDANFGETGEEAKVEEFPNTHTSNMSYQEYFARRMKDLKAARGKEVEEPGSPEQEGVTQEFSAKTRSKGKSRKLQPEDSSEKEVTKEPSSDESTAEAEVAKRKRRKKKRAAADECREEALGEGDVASVTKQATEEGSCDGEQRKLRLSDPDGVCVENKAPANGLCWDRRKKGKRFVEGDVTSAEAKKAKKVVQRAVDNDNGTSRSACLDVSRENLDTAKQDEFRHRKERKVLETIDEGWGSDKVAAWEEGEKGAAIGNDRVIVDDGAIGNDEAIGDDGVIGCGGVIDSGIDENRKKRKKAKRKRAQTEGEDEGNEAEENKEGDTPMPKCKKTKKKAKMDGRPPDEETQEMAVDENDESKVGETTEPPRNNGSKAAERTPLKLVKNKKKPSPIVRKRKVPRMNADNAGHLAQWIVESPEASKAADRLAMGNKALLASRLRNLLLREHKGSNWALIPGYGSPAWMEKCTALLALTLREQEEAKVGEGTTG